MYTAIATFTAKSGKVFSKGQQITDFQYFFLPTRDKIGFSKKVNPIKNYVPNTGVGKVTKNSYDSDYKPSRMPSKQYLRDSEDEVKKSKERWKEEERLKRINREEDTSSAYLWGTIADIPSINHNDDTPSFGGYGGGDTGGGGVSGTWDSGYSDPGGSDSGGGGDCGGGDGGGSD